MSVRTLHCHHTPLPSVLLCPQTSRSSWSLRPSHYSQARPTVSRSMSSVSLPAASDANIWSKVCQNHKLKFECNSEMYNCSICNASILFYCHYIKLLPSTVASTSGQLMLPTLFKSFWWSALFGFKTGNSKQGLRCKACKLAAHLWCSSELSQQACNGKVRPL